MEIINSTIVLIPHYNDSEGLYNSISSIHKEENVDVLIVDDGSSKDCFDTKKIESLKFFNGKLITIINKKNNGIEYVLNQGLEYAISNKYKYVARLDAGDLCLKERFKKQINFMEKNGDIALLGTQVNFVNKKGEILFDKKLPTEDSVIRKKMHLNSMFIHPSVIFRTCIIDKVGFYPLGYKAAEDFAYFFKIMNNYKVANLEEKLLSYEINYEGISMTNRNKQIKTRLKILKENFKLSFWSIYGIILNYIILMIPIETMQKLKNIYFNK